MSKKKNETKSTTETKSSETKKSTTKKVKRSRSDLYSSAFRGRYWAFIVYEEHFDVWYPLIIELGLCCALSPLHCNDLYEDGTLKKPHYHVLVDFGRRYSEGSALCLLRGLPVNNKIEPVSNPQSYYRYLYHADNPEKALYKEGDIRFFGGFEVDNLPSCRLEASLELTQIIIKYSFSSYRSLCQFLIEINRIDLYQILVSNSSHFRSLLSCDCIDNTQRAYIEKVKKHYSNDYVSNENGFFSDVDPSLQQLV